VKGQRAAPWLNVKMSRESGDKNVMMMKRAVMAEVVSEATRQQIMTEEEAGDRVLADGVQETGPG
jgi:hypothetical protein